MHILIIPSWYVNSYNPLSGVFFKEQAEALAKSGEKVGVLSVQPISLKSIILQKKIDFKLRQFTENKAATIQIQFPSLPKLATLNSTISLLLGKKLFRAYVAKNGLPEIIHLHSYALGNLALWIKKQYEIKFIVTEHSSAFARNILSLKQLKTIQEIFENSAQNIAVSESLSRLLSEKFRSKFITIPNVINTNYFLPKLHPEGNYTFLNVAFLNENKKQAMLIEAFANAFKSDELVKLIIAGDGPCYSSLEAIIMRLKVHNQIKLFGRASREQVLELMQSASSFVLTSQHETFGVVLVEAMSCGLPVLSTKSGGPETIISNAMIGELCDHTVDSLSTAMLTMKSKQQEYNSNYIRAFAIDNYSEKIIIEKMRSIYKNTLSHGA